MRHPVQHSGSLWPPSPADDTRFQGLLLPVCTRAQVRVLLPNGERRSSRVGFPVGLEQYVRPAEQFARWAFTPPRERQERLDRCASTAVRVEAELAALRRVMCVTQVRRLPQELLNVQILLFPCLPGLAHGVRHLL